MEVLFMNDDEIVAIVNEVFLRVSNHELGRKTGERELRNELKNKGCDSKGLKKAIAFFKHFCDEWRVDK